LQFKKKGFNIFFVVERKALQIEFRHLESFCHVADLKSFSRAADDFSLTEPTVSGHILSLEQSLSLRLFDRARREVRITKSGEVFREEASGTRIVVERALRRKGRTLKQFNVVMETGSTSSVKEGVKAQLGLAFIPGRATEGEVRQGSFSRIDVEGLEPISRQIYIVSHRRKTLSPMATEFLRFPKEKKETH
jgi:DNA-binding transcriptional LysR family regulator